MKLKNFLVALVLSVVAPACLAQTTFRIPVESGGAWSSNVVLAPTYVNARSLAANVAESFTTPSGAKFVVFSATCDFYALPTGTATVPGDVTNGTASMLNPSAWYIEGIASVSVIATVACVVTSAWYN